MALNKNNNNHGDDYDNIVVSDHHGYCDEILASCDDNPSTDNPASNLDSAFAEEPSMVIDPKKLAALGYQIRVQYRDADSDADRIESITIHNRIGMPSEETRAIERTMRDFEEALVKNTSFSLETIQAASMAAGKPLAIAMISRALYTAATGR